MLVFCVPSRAWVCPLWLGLRSLLPVSRSPKCPFCPQVAHFKDYIPQAFPGGHSMILDSEVLLIDNKTGRPLPFGTLGVHKVAAQAGVRERVCTSACVCCRSKRQGINRLVLQ